MKVSNLRLLLRPFYPFFIAIAALWAMPRTARAQLYVTQTSLPSGIGVVSEYDATTGEVINAKLITGVSYPFALAVTDPDLYFYQATLFVSSLAQSGFRTVGKYNATTGGAINPSFITGLSEPIGLAWDDSTLILYVAGADKGTVGKYSAISGAANPSFITGLSKPWGVALKGNILFVVNFASGTVGKYDAITGHTIKASFITGLKQPSGLAVSGNTLFVADHDTGTVGEYDANTGATINATFITGLSLPVGIAVKSAK